MALFLSHKEPLYRWGVWKMDESVDTLLDLLPEREYYEREVQRFVASHRRLEWLSVRALLFRLLGEHKEVCYQPSGKPYLADHSYFISISHTKGYVSVILSDKVPVGIDIEQYGQRVHRVAHKYMREDEPVRLYKEDAAWSLLLHWSAKEVMFKCMDTDGVDFRQHLHIEPFLLQEQGDFIAHEYRTEQKRSFQIHYLLHPEFVMTWSID
ncbi:4'-phosphopantetheinyl transferase family protein [Bacteroides salyersiae]|jgi:4'-phosphopantetheinyl transferase|uniref:4'-phosphopantetheinyl transferase family protein n=1 Tax=Bacteroides salyersiae TaxID=291644 RepID=UPI001C8BEAC1|nr:4'-phosphopantetheinyl transferase superfamily protein [Bacteroides salyersiae]